MDNAIANTISQTAFQAQAPHFALAGGGKKAQTPEAINKTAKEFESMFISQMVNLLFKGVSSDPLFGNKASSDIYRSLLLDQYGKSIAETISFGIADQVRGELLKLQEVQQSHS